jgi:hypothetical protein
MPYDLEPNPRHEHLILLGASVPPHGVTVLLDPSLPSCSGCWQDFIIHSITLYIQIGGSLWY